MADGVMDWNSQSEATAFSEFATDRQISPMCFRNVFDDTQAQPGAANATGIMGIDSVVLLKHTTARWCL